MKIDYIHILFNKNYVTFLQKIFTVYIVFIVFTGIIFSKISSSYNKNYGYEIAKNYVKGLIVNPQAFIVSSEIYYKNQRFIKARDELIYALTIYELNGKSPDAINNIKAKITFLNEKIASQTSLQDND